jgi:MFS family permease
VPEARADLADGRHGTMIRQDHGRDAPVRRGRRLGHGPVRLPSRSWQPLVKRTFASLAFHNYRLWFIGASVSNVGTWMQRIAQDWLVLTVLTNDSGVAVGVTTAFQFGPFLFLSPWAGVLADRLDHRRLLIATQIGGSILGLGLGSLVLLGHVQLWHVYVFAFLLGCVSAIDGPIRQTFVSDLVPAEHLPNAVGLNSASFNAARLIGPGVAGLMIAAVGTGWVFLVNAFTFVATIVALLAMRPAELASAPVASRRRGRIREGLHYVRGRPDLLAIIVLVGFVSAFGLNFQLTSALMARTVFDKGPGEYGLLGTLMAIGTLWGSLLAARRKRPGLPLVIGAAIAFAVTEGALALMPNYASFGIACIPVGLAALTMMTAANATLQTTSSPTMRGRAMSLYMMVFLGVAWIGSPIVGWVGERFGARWSLGIGAIVSFVAALAVGAWGIRRGRIAVEYGLRPPRARVVQGRIRPGSAAEAAARADAALEVGEQQAEDIAHQP